MLSQLPITVFLHNLALAVFVGVVLSALVFAWKSAQHVRLYPKTLDDGSSLQSAGTALFWLGQRVF